MSPTNSVRVASPRQQVPSDYYYWMIVPASRRDGGPGFMVEEWFHNECCNRDGPMASEGEAREFIKQMDDSLIAAKRRLSAALYDLGDAITQSLQDMAKKLMQRQ